MADASIGGNLWCMTNTLTVFTGSMQWGWLVASLEWIVFSCTHSSGANWKLDFEKAPGFVKMVMAKGWLLFQCSAVIFRAALIWMLLMSGMCP